MLHDDISENLKQWKDSLLNVIGDVNVLIKLDISKTINTDNDNNDNNDNNDEDTKIDGKNY